MVALQRSATRVGDFESLVKCGGGSVMLRGYICLEVAEDLSLKLKPENKEGFSQAGRASGGRV